MKAIKFASGLKAFASTTDTQVVDSIIALASILEGQKNATVLAFVKKASSLDVDVNADASRPTVQDIHKALEVLEATLRALTTKATADDAMRLCTMLAQHKHESAQHYLQRLDEHLKQAATRRSASTKAPKEMNLALVREYLDALEDASKSSAAFEELIAKLSKDRRVRLKIELTEISNSFYGVKFRYQTKKKALDTIRRRQEQDMRVVNEDRAFGG